MPVLSLRRQVTIPKGLCDRLHLHPGDVLDVIEHEGRITLIKKRQGASAGILKHLTTNKSYSEEDSRAGTLKRRLAASARNKGTKK